MDEQPQGVARLFGSGRDRLVCVVGATVTLKVSTCPNKVVIDC